MDTPLQAERSQQRLTTVSSTELLAFYNDREDENWKKQITHRHVHNHKVDTFPHGFRLVDKYSDEGISKQRDNKNQAISKCFADLFSWKVVRTGAIR